MIAWNINLILNPKKINSNAHASESEEGADKLEEVEDEEMPCNIKSVATEDG